ncbi:hypothetical protein PAXRUDRAFT_832002, partial [Paxillus rubicundulus Ve08.2h10]
MLLKQLKASFLRRYAHVQGCLHKVVDKRTVRRGCLKSPFAHSKSLNSSADPQTF